MNTYKIVIPDIHQNVDKLKQIINSDDGLNAQEIICLGDYFDSFDYDFNTKVMCDFLNSKIDDERFTFLLGNHDVHYLTKCKNYTCSGWTHRKQVIIDENLDKGFLNKAKIWKYEKNNGKHLLYSHAGLHPSFAPFFLDKMLEEDTIQNWLDNQEQIVKDSMFANNPHPLLEAGKDRGGYQKHGGVTWMDWYNFKPIPYLNQIVGHSHMSRPSFKNVDNSQNICIDTGLKNYLKIYIETGDWEICKS
jgi:predicted phosphodiesterase